MLCWAKQQGIFAHYVYPSFFALFFFVMVFHVLHLFIVFFMIMFRVSNLFRICLFIRLLVFFFRNFLSCFLSFSSSQFHFCSKIIRIDFQTYVYSHSFIYFFVLPINYSFIYLSIPLFVHLCLFIYFLICLFIYHHLLFLPDVTLSPSLLLARLVRVASEARSPWLLGRSWCVAGQHNQGSMCNFFSFFRSESQAVNTSESRVTGDG